MVGALFMKIPFALPVVLATLRTVARLDPFAVSATPQMLLTIYDKPRCYWA